MIMRVDSEGVVEEAARVFAKGGVIVYPTDTAYGLGIDAMDGRAVDKLYRLKGRGYDKPTHVVVADWEMITRLCRVDERARKLYEAFMPGALTLVVPDAGVVDRRLGAGTGTLGVRIPDSSFTRDLSRKLDRPYTTPSANRAGGRTPYSLEEVGRELGLGGVDLAVDAGRLPETAPSTIVDLSGEGWKVLRVGPIQPEEIGRILGQDQ